MTLRARLAAIVALGTLAGCTRSGEVLRPGGPVVLTTSAVRLSTGQNHACAIAAGALRCWGDDGDGRLGVAASGTGTGAGPVTVPGGPWLAPAAGNVHTCALATDGTVWCWGGNMNGQLGSGDFDPSVAPRQVALRAKAVDVRTGFEFTCALLADASLWCWGYNWEGQLGQGDTHPGTDRPSPVQVGTTNDWVFVSAGQGHGCGIRAPGTLHCWGRNTDGQIGQGATQPPQHRTPTQVGGDDDWIEVSAGQGTTCARKRDDSLWCWGTMESGALGVGDVAPHPVPTRVPVGANDWLGISTNTLHTCGLRAGGEIWCAGRNTEGQTGAADLVDVIPTMMRADPTAGWTEARAGRFFSCGRKADESVSCLGDNEARQLATDPTTLDRSPAMIPIVF